VRELNNALLGLIIEGVSQKSEVQAWLTTFGVPQEKLDLFKIVWESHSRKLFVFIAKGQSNGKTSGAF
jgi:hypothetical protein